MSLVDEVFDRRKRYWVNAYRPLEIWNPDQTINDKNEPLKSPGKQPRGAAWQRRAMQTPPEAVRLEPDPRALNTGLLCGERLIGVDVDVPVQLLADQIVILAETAFEPTPLVRIGLPPKILLAYRVETAFRKIQTPELFLRDGTKCKVELLAKGQQFVCDGIHPDTGKPYWWTRETPETVHLDELPAIDEEQARGFIEGAERLLRQAGAKEKERTKPNGHDHTGHRGQAGTFFLAVNRAALSDIKAWLRAIFPRARFEPGTGAWRVSSAELGRDLEEDISVHPDGIWDFGEEQPRTAIDIVLRYGNTAKPFEAAIWLCNKLGVDLTDLGYVNGRRPDNRTAHSRAKANGHANDVSAGIVDPEDWPDPAALLDIAPAPPFPAEFLPGAVGQFVQSHAFDLQVPLDFVAIPLLIVAGVAIGNEFRMAPKMRAGWAERACLWGGCIGYVGDGKTPAFNAALSPIWPLQKKWREEFQEEIKEYKAAVKRAKAIAKQWEKLTAAALKRGDDPPPIPDDAEPPEMPIAREIITNDTTQERVALLLQHNPRGVLLYRDELSGWFSSFNQYRPGADEQFYLQCHAGGPWLQHRVKGDIVIPDIYLAVFGGFQPDVIAAALARGVHTGRPDKG